MLYLFSLLILLITNFVFLYTADKPRQRIPYLSSLGLLLLGAFFLSNKHSFSASNTPFLLCDLFAALVLIYPLILKVINASAWNKIFPMVGLLAATLIVFDIINNFYFFHDDSRSGFINPKGIQHDTPCSSKALIFVRISESTGEVHYRCPTEPSPDLFIVIGNPFNTPLIPWPNYYSGKSKALRNELHKIDENVIRIEKKDIITK